MINVVKWSCIDTQTQHCIYKLNGIRGYYYD